MEVVDSNGGRIVFRMNQILQFYRHDFPKKDLELLTYIQSGLNPNSDTSKAIDRVKKGAEYKITFKKYNFDLNH